MKNFGAKVGRDACKGHDILLRHLHPPHLHQVLRNLRYSLLALVRDKVGPVDELRIDLPVSATGIVPSRFPASFRKIGHGDKTAHLRQGLLIVIAQLDPLPHVCRRMCSFDCLDIEIQGALHVSIYPRHTSPSARKCLIPLVDSKFSLFPRRHKVVHTFFLPHGSIPRVGQRT